MCGIAGFFKYKQNYEGYNLYNNNECIEILYKMRNVLKHRGNDDYGIYTDSVNNNLCNIGLAHSRLSIIDLNNGHQPMEKNISNRKYIIIYNGEIYNQKELKKDLLNKGYSFETTSDTEIILNGFIEYGVSFVEKLNGIFAYAIFDKYKQQLHIFRDRLGVKPLFYTVINNTIVFGSELKALFEYPNIKPIVDKNGLNEIFSIGPAKSYGCGVYKNINELLPGYFITCYDNGINEYCYWKLESKPHKDNYKETVEKTKFLIKDAIKRQMVSDVPICTFLSGGIDSSIVSSICANELKKEGKQLHTFSFDFVDNYKYFKSNSFQPSQDKPFVEKMVKFLNSKHHFLECETTKQIDLLTNSVDAHDLPCMADIDSSMLYFCSVVSNTHKVALTGECADEIFGGYPWFHKKECFEANTFPWTMDLETRKSLLSEEFLNKLNMEEYIFKAYNKSISETPKYCYDNELEARRREISYLNLKWFMQTLLDRMDRTSMYSGLEARVPFADYRIVEYLWNVPWEMKIKTSENNNVVKGLLREASKEILPYDILNRKKSPYPKTYDINYEKMLISKINDIITNKSSKILDFLDINKLKKFIQSPSDYGKPWYGQLMAAPQMLAYIIQIDYWLKKYNVKIEL